MTILYRARSVSCDAAVVATVSGNHSGPRPVNSILQRDDIVPGMRHEFKAPSQSSHPPMFFGLVCHDHPTIEQRSNGHHDLQLKTTRD